MPEINEVCVSSGSGDIPNAEEKVDIKKIDAEKPPSAPFGKLFRYADVFDVILMVLGTIGAIIQGSVHPIQFLIFGKLSDAFIGYARCPNSNNSSNCTHVDVEAELTRFSYYYIIIAVCIAVAIIIQMVTWGVTAERQVHKMRKAYFKSILRQDMTWFNTFDSGKLSTRLTDDLSKIADGMGYKFAMIVQSLAALISGYTLGFVHGWKLTLVIISVFPLVVMIGGFLSSVMTSLASKEVESYASAGSIALEVLSSVRTVIAFGGEKKETERYNKCVKAARVLGERKGFITGICFGLYTLLMYGSYSLSFWYGGKLAINKEMSGGDILVVFFCVMNGSAIVGQAGPYFQAITAARASAYEIFALIDRVPSIDIYSNEGLVPDTLQGDISFEDVSFNYPTRPDVQVLKNFSLHVETGKKIAFVGESGCGKSTVIKLLQRFYDCTGGMIKIDGNDIKSLNLKWLRQRIGVVSQEPVLFSTTIAENISYGKEDVTQEEIEEAAKIANAHDFIKQLPEGYETLCGERGAKLSGGQKQRVAIARAFLRNPQILLLDEATSALDTESESLVQDALDRAGKGRTTIVIAHRLSTIRNADLIVAIQNGDVVETGTHEELIEKNGVYKELVTLQIYAEDNVETPAVKVVCEDGVQHLEKIDSEKMNETGKKRKLTADNKESLELECVPLVKIKNNDEEMVHEEPASILRIIQMAISEWRYYLLGTIGATLKSAYPFIFAFILAELLAEFQNDLNSPIGKQKIKEGTRFWSLLFLAMAGGMFIGHFLQDWMYGVGGEILTEKLRKRAFECLLTQDIGYFDDPAHSTGALVAILATNASEVKGAVGSRLGIITSSLITSLGCLLLAFFSGWKLALVVLAFIPFLVVAGFLRSKFFLAGKAGKAVDVEESSKVAVEIIQNIETVASLTKEETFYNKYIEKGSDVYKQRRSQSVVSGLLMSLSMPVFLLSSAAAYRFAGYLVANGEMTFPGVLKTILAVQLGSVFFGQLAAFMPDYLKAKLSASRLFELFDTVPTIKTNPNAGKGSSHGEIEGCIKFEDVTFSYPFRSESKILQGLSLEIAAGKTVALVGASGCGKSTMVSLIGRLYDIDSGLLTIDGCDIKTFDVTFLRSQIGVVSQEPVLFNYSMRENIAYGDTTREIPQEEIEEVAKSANIHDFISSLPEGYDTIVGEKGTLISGGQKQRIAIARALIRNPKILLLDEATSALDTENEKMVQEALDRARVGRTTIVIAHRLSTIQKADFTAVLQSGIIVEKGTHQNLMEMKGVYYNLHQSRDADQIDEQT